jgi:LysM repeat protein
MTDRGLPIVDGAPACPFVAFEDDRDERASSPDHRHRCYAELSPAPRALAHQEAYCLASAFPVCPTFQDWARREAARARSTAGKAVPASSDAAAERNPTRDWSAPPPWAGEPGEEPPGYLSGGAGVAGAGLAAAGLAGPAGPNDEDVSAPGFLSGRSRPERGLAGSAADRIAGGGDEPQGATPRVEGERSEVDEEAEPPVAARPPAPVSPPSPSRPAGRPPVVAAAPPARTAAPDPLGGPEDDDWDDEEAWEDEPARPAPAERGRGALGLPLGDRRPKVGDTRRRREPDPAPSWERPRRFEAYPTLKTRVGLPLPSFASLPRIGVAALALVIAAVALLFLPTLLGIGGPDDAPGGGASPSATAAGGAPSASVAPTPVPAPTQTIYLVQPGDTLSKIANQFGISLAELIAANRETLPNPDVLAIGDQLIIPTPVPEQLPGASVAPSASAP